MRTAGKVWHWDRDGRPVGLFLWAWLLDQRTYKNVARGHVFSASEPEKHVCVSTIWFGIDMNHGLVSDAPPLMFETAILRPVAPDADDYSLEGFTVDELYRSFTEAQARDTHDRVVTYAADRFEDPIITHQPIVPARPRAGWASVPDGASVSHGI